MSRYPSSYGHTPSYRSYRSLAGVPTWPSALGYSDDDFSFRTGLLGSGTRLLGSGLHSHFDQEFSTLKSSLLDDSLLFDPLLRYDPITKTTSNSSSKVSSYRSEEAVSSVNGGAPHRVAYSDSTARSTSVGRSGIPHNSYSHRSTSYDSHRPYANRVTSYSYNI